jgi:hypothetical protein
MLLGSGNSSADRFMPKVSLFPGNGTCIVMFNAECRACAGPVLWQPPQWPRSPAAGFHSSSMLSAQLARKPKPASGKKQGSAEAASKSGSKSAEDARKEIARAKTGGRYQLPPVMMGANQVKLAPISPNIIAEPYK